MKIAVLFGGASSERDVSVASGVQVAKIVSQNSATGLRYNVSDFIDG